MDILILGNGFDLAHELDTKYTDFLNYCRKNNLINNNVWLRHFSNRQQELGNKWIDLEEEIYAVIKTINKDLQSSTRNYKFEIFPKAYIFQNDYLEKDFTLEKIIFQLENLGKKHQTDQKEYTSFKGMITNYSYYFFATHKGLINFLYDQLRDVTEKFDTYLKKEILPNIGNKKYKFSLINNTSIRVLNFNYTNTYEELYDPHNIYPNTNPKYIYVHGKVCDSNVCNLILGTHSFYNHLPNDINEEINTEFNVFKKHNQRHKYGTIEAYQNLLKELKDKRKIIKPKFHVIGHSLDKADHNILKHIFKAKEDSIINIYYHKQEALDRLINNITDIIGEEEVMAKVRFIYQHDPDRGILIPIEEPVLVEK